MAIQDFTAGQILTAAQMDSLQANDYNWTVSTKTASYTLVAADKGTRIVMNSGSATTITVNTSIFAAGDTLYLQNIGAGVTTLTAGTATVSSAGPLAIPQYGSGLLYFTSAGVSIYFPSAVTASASGLTLISATTISAAATTNVNDVFSTTYDNYKVFFNGTASTGTDVPVTLKLRVSGADATTNYTYQRLVTTSTTTVVDRDVFGTDEFGVVGINGNAYYGFDITIINPFNASPTKFIATSVGSNPAGVTQNFVQGVNTNSTSYTGFSLLTSGSISGTLKIYGLAN